MKNIGWFFKNFHTNLNFSLEFFEEFSNFVSALGLPLEKCLPSENHGNELDEVFVYNPQISSLPLPNSKSYIKPCISMVNFVVFHNFQINELKNLKLTLDFYNPYYSHSFSIFRNFILLLYSFSNYSREFQTEKSTPVIY